MAFNKARNIIIQNVLINTRPCQLLGQVPQNGRHFGVNKGEHPIHGMSGGKLDPGDHIQTPINGVLYGAVEGGLYSANGHKTVHGPMGVVEAFAEVRGVAAVADLVVEVVFVGGVVGDVGRVGRPRLQVPRALNYAIFFITIIPFPMPIVSVLLKVIDNKNLNAE